MQWLTLLISLILIAVSVVIVFRQAKEANKEAKAFAEWLNQLEQEIHLQDQKIYGLNKQDAKDVGLIL